MSNISVIFNERSDYKNPDPAYGGIKKNIVASLLIFLKIKALLRQDSYGENTTTSLIFMQY